jgi:hypothetical protein
MPRIGPRWSVVPMILRESERCRDARLTGCVVHCRIQSADIASRSDTALVSAAAAASPCFCERRCRDRGPLATEPDLPSPLLNAENGAPNRSVPSPRDRATVSSGHYTGRRQIRAVPANGDAAPAREARIRDTRRSRAASPDRDRRQQRFCRCAGTSTTEGVMPRCNQMRDLIDSTILRDIAAHDLCSQAGINFPCTAVIGHLLLSHHLI